MISTNYLGSLLQKYAGFPLAPYNQYLLAQREELPVLNWIDCYTKDGEWHYMTDDFAYKSWIENYRLLQYNSLFDGKRKKEYYVVEERKDHTNKKY